MPCYHPLKTFQKNPGDSLVFASGNFQLEKRWNFANKYHCKDIIYGEALRTNCQQCIGCRMTYCRNWAIRCCLEALCHPEDSCWFVTLTYNDLFVPRSFACDPDTGEVLYETLTLRKRDFQLFMKRFRKLLFKKFNLKIRFFGCGEYGELTKRPHYHFILFGLPYDQSIFKPCKVQNSGHLMYDVDPLIKAWSDRRGRSMGFCPVEVMTFDAAAYVAGYMLKKVKGKESLEYYASHGLQPEFSIMSRKPGIAGSYFDMYSDEIYENDSLLKRFGHLDYTPRPPKYFDDLFRAHHPDELALIKKSRRESARNSFDMLLNNLGVSEEDYLRSEEERIKSSCRRSKKC